MNDLKKIIKIIKMSSGSSGTISQSSIKVIQEIIFSIYVNGRPLANIACAGIHLKELALGFLKSEKIINNKGDVSKIELNKDCVNVILKNKKDFATACVKNIASSGARGKTNIDLLVPLNVPSNFYIKTGMALKLMDDLMNDSLVHNQTGGTHCSALAAGKKIISLREDIGRHNTIDMLAGYALLKNINLNKTIILTTGRISSEIVYKVWNMGIPVIISHSAPTANAIELSRSANILLIGYVRRGKMNIYTHERRVII